MFMSLLLRISMGGIMSDCIDTVSSLMPSSSKFEGSDLQKILDETIGQYFDEVDNRIEELVDAPFLSEAEGDYLDLLYGRLYGVSRGVDESDDEYRTRLMFQASDKMRVKELVDLGCSVYAYVEDYNAEWVLTSRNTSLTDKIMVEFPSSLVEELVKDNCIWEKILVSV